METILILITIIVSVLICLIAPISAAKSARKKLRQCHAYATVIESLQSEDGISIVRFVDEGGITREAWLWGSEDFYVPGTVVRVIYSADDPTNVVPLDDVKRTESGDTWVLLIPLSIIAILVLLAIVGRYK